FGDEIKTKTGRAEGGDLLFRRENHLGVFNRVLEIVFLHCPREGSGGSLNRQWRLRARVAIEVNRRYLIERRSFECAGRDLATPTRSPAEDGFAGDKREREPDQNESDEVPAGERFVIKEDSEEERTNWRKILEETDGNEAEM